MGYSTRTVRHMRKLYFGRRKQVFFLALVALFAWAAAGLVLCWRLSRVTSSALLLPPPPDQDFAHFRRSASLKHYMDNVQLLIEPTSSSCLGVEEVAVVVLVASAPARFEHRDAVRRTWGKRQPTYFVLGLDGPSINEQLIDNYVEAKQYGDMVVFDFQDHYQNLTLKTALMLRWTLGQCPQAEFMMKTDDDALINPWALRDVLRENADAKLVGYMQNNSVIHREMYNKWYIPRWLRNEDMVPQYLTGPGYLINGNYIQQILRAAYKTPLINVEDVYFTYQVAKQTLGLSLTHDARLTPYRPWPPWLPLGCAYWLQASIHSLTPDEVLRIWNRVAAIGEEFERNVSVCDFYRHYVAYFVYLY